MRSVDDTPVDAPDLPDGVLDLLREQASLYAKLESMAGRQRSLVTEDDVGPLLGLLADRQRLSAQLTKLSTRLAPVRREWETCRRCLSPAQQAEADRLLSDAGGRLRRIIESDEQDARVLSGRKQAVATALQATHSTSQALQAYRAPTGRSDRLDCVAEGA